MSTAYFDTSALVKAYLLEQGSDWLRAFLYADDSPKVFTSRLSAIEAVCALARRRREGSLTPDRHVRLLAALEYDLRYHYNLVGVENAVIEAAKWLANQHPLRAYDAVQLATAWLANKELAEADRPPLTFVCADVRLLAIARDEGLQVENPAAHA